ncbi:MAG: fused chorismate mutase/prephenate dehydratase [Sodalis sp. Fse]|nr:MAG: fused chorismate mutase/prephenate dehydratase [Sodalis sp. Fse]
MNDNSLLAICEQISALDLKLLSLLAKRRTLDLARSKINSQCPIGYKTREHDLLERLMAEGQKLKLDSFYVTRMFQMITEDPVLMQQAMLQSNLNHSVDHSARIAFLGPEGSYSHLAAKQYGARYFNHVVECGCHKFIDIAQLVETGQAEYGILPIENSSSGSINEVYDLLQHTHLSLVGEVTIPIDHCLLANSKLRLDQIETIYSHPQPFQQCSQFLTNFPQWNIEYCESTASAMEKVAQLNCSTAAALGGGQGGAIYGLQVLKHNLANQQKNITRFIVLARNAIEVIEQVPAKTMMIMAIRQKSHALVKALLVLRTHAIVMTQLKSRPIPDKPCKEMFYIDVKANLRNVQMQKALQEIQRLTCSLKILGCYPSQNIV